MIYTVKFDSLVESFCIIINLQFHWKHDSIFFFLLILRCHFCEFMHRIALLVANDQWIVDIFFFYSKLNQRQQWNHFSFYLSNVIFNSILKLIAIHGNAFFQKKQIGFAGLGSDSVHRCLNDDVNFHSNKIGCVPLPCSINGKTLNLKNIFKKHRRC